MAELDHEPVKRSWPARVAGALAFVVLALVVWVDQTTLPIAVEVAGPVDSFQSGIEHFFLHPARAGVDWIFTYGPLGILTTLTYNPELFAGQLLWVHIVWRAVCAALVVAAFLRNPGVCERVLAFVVLVLLPIEPDAYVYLFTLAAADLAVERPRGVLGAALLIVALVPVSLAKFTSFALGVPLVLLVAFARWRGDSWRAGLSFLLAAMLAWAAAWSASGQAWLDAPVFLWRSMQMAAAYGGSMGSEGPAEGDARAILVALLAVVVLVLPLAHRLREPVALAQALVRVIVCLVVFKAGLVRGADHASIFFAFVALAVFVSTRDASAGTARRVAHAGLRHATWVLAGWSAIDAYGLKDHVATQLAGGAGAQVDTVVDFLAHPRAWNASLGDQLLAAERARALPRTRAAVGGDPIDIHPPYADVVLMNGLTWRPRPVFQSYATLTAEFQETNARFFESDRAPTWFLIQPRPIDWRLETMEDAALLQVVARDFRPVLAEHGYLLVRRDPPGTPRPEERVVLDADLAFGTVLDLRSLAGTVHLLAIEATPTLAGRARQLVLRPAELKARIVGVTGRERVVRLVPSMLARGAIVDPILAETNDWVRWYAGTAERTATFELLAPDPAWAWPGAIHVRIASTTLRPAVIEPDLEKRLSYPMFETMPDAYDGVTPCEFDTVDGAPVLVVGTPSALRFRVRAGSHRVSGVLGLTPRSYDPGESDGASFGAELDPGGDARTIFQHTIDPRSRARERGLVPFQFAFETVTDAELVLRTGPGPAQDARDDRVFWSRVRVE